MKSNRRYSTNELIEYIELYLDGTSFHGLREDYDLNLKESTFRLYSDKYFTHGIPVLMKPQMNRNYSKVFRHQMVQEYLNNY